MTAHRIASLLLAVALSFDAGGAAERERPSEEPAASSLPWEEMGRILGIEGTRSDGGYKIAIPQSDLDVKVDGFDIIPPMGTTSWVAFLPMEDRARIMGDLVLLEDEFQPVEAVLIDGGLRITAIHNHFLRDAPKVMFMHVGGSGDPLMLARAVRTVLDKVAELRRAKGLAARDRSVSSTLDGDALSRILGRPGRSSGGVYKIVIGRPGVELHDAGVPVTTFSGFNTWMAFQGAPERAAVAGDFAMLAHEVTPVIRALAAHDIEVTAVHNHMVQEEPRIFFLHFWGVGNADGLAMGLKAALDAQANAPDAPPRPPARANLWTFEGAAAVPPGFQPGLTGAGTAVDWRVVEVDDAPSGDHAVAQLSADPTNRRYPLLVLHGFEARDVDLEVKFKTVSGEVDASGGLVFRYRDDGNYYVVRANALEGNVVAYKTENGRRSNIGVKGRGSAYGVAVDVPHRRWNRLRVTARGNLFEIFLNGRKLFEVEDDTFRDAGRIGLWTKADAVTQFDDLRAASLDAGH